MVQIVSKQNAAFDFLVIGGGILGLSLAEKTLAKFPSARIAVLEKEKTLGYHGSGRNSGVLHSGIYYPEGSLKAKFSAAGARQLQEFCQAERLPIVEMGKVILPTKSDDDPVLDHLMARAKPNQVTAELIDAAALAKIEPLCRSATGRAIYVPTSCVVDPKAIINRQAEILTQRGVKIFYDSEMHTADPLRNHVVCKNGTSFAFGHLINSAGLCADQVAHQFAIGKEYVIMPFKGLYYEWNSPQSRQVNGLIYPVPDLRMPFLGVHFTKSVHSTIYIGPNAVPALGRENYTGFTGIKPVEATAILGRNLAQYIRNEQGFRRLVHTEVSRLKKSQFVKAAQALIPSTAGADIMRSKKVGIRAQLYDTHTHRLVMDFLVESGPRSTHILNAISPGFTCGPSFAEHVVAKYVQ